MAEIVRKVSGIDNSSCMGAGACGHAPLRSRAAVVLLEESASVGWRGSAPAKHVFEVTTNFAEDTGGRIFGPCSGIDRPGIAQHRANAGLCFGVLEEKVDVPAQKMLIPKNGRHSRMTVPYASKRRCCLTLRQTEEHLP